MWGVFAVDNIRHPDVYTKRTHCYVLKQLFNFVKSGFNRIDNSTSLPDMTLSSFYDPRSRTVVITGMNDSSSAQTMEWRRTGNQFRDSREQVDKLPASEYMAMMFSGGVSTWRLCVGDKI